MADRRSVDQAVHLKVDRRPRREVSLGDRPAEDEAAERFGESFELTVRYLEQVALQKLSRTSS